MALLGPRTRDRPCEWVGPIVKRARGNVRCLGAIRKFAVERRSDRDAPFPAIRRIGEASLSTRSLPELKRDANKGGSNGRLYTLVSSNRCPSLRALYGAMEPAYGGSVSGLRWGQGGRSGAGRRLWYGCHISGAGGAGLHGRWA